MPDYQKELMEYRIQTAKEKLHSAKVLLDVGEYKDSIGRSYYAMFSIIPAQILRSAHPQPNRCDIWEGISPKLPQPNISGER